MKKNNIRSIVLLIVAMTTSSLISQTQVGLNINGEAENDFSGASVSFSTNGNRLAIGAPLNDGNGVDAGNVRVYEWDGISWGKVGSDIDGEAEGDWLGNSVSLSSDGTKVAVGSPWNNDNGENSGQVQVFNWNGNEWVQMGEDINGENAGDFSGWSVSLSGAGETVAIGAVMNGGNGNNAGHVRLFNWNGSNWVQFGEDIDGEAEGDNSGSSISLSSNGNRVAIGAELNDGNGDWSGQVRVHEWDGTEWQQLGSDIDGEAEGDQFGFSVSLSSDGNRVAVGAHRNDSNSEDAGQIKIYEWNGSDWSQIGNTINGKSLGDRAGRSVSISSDGTRVVFGAIGNESNGNNIGQVRIYDWDSGNWVQVGIVIDGEEEGDNAGSSVAIANGGNWVAVGAIGNDGNGMEAGNVRVFEIAPVSYATVEKINLIDIKPNPTYGKIEIIGIEANTIRITDTEGKSLVEFNEPGREIDISSLPPGVYFVQMILRERKVTKKIIKK